MELISFVIAAGETKRFERAGRYLEIIDAASALDVYLSDADGARGDNARGALSGLFMEGAYSAFEVTSAAAQSVTLLLTDGRGGSRRQPGNVTVIDAVQATCETQSGFNTAIAAFTPVTIVAPAANTAGLLLRSLSVTARAGAGGQAQAFLIASLVAPVGLAGANQILLAAAVDTDGAVKTQASPDLKKRIPTGWGLYYAYVNTTAIAVANSYIASFERL